MSAKLVYALASDGLWHVHREGCADATAARRALKYQEDLHRFDAATEAAVIDYIIDPEVAELGYGEHDVRIFPCAATAIRKARREAS